MSCGCPAYLRYVDDFLLFGDDKAQLWDWRAAIIERLAGLRLTHPRGSAQVQPVQTGIPFLGFVVYPTHRLLKRRKGIAVPAAAGGSAGRLPPPGSQPRGSRQLRAGLDQPRALRRHLGPAAGHFEGRAPVTENRAEMPIFAKTYDFLAWLVPLTNNFPRAQRHTVTQRLLDAALNFLERLVDANTVRGAARHELLDAADAELDKVRLYLRLAHHWRWITPGQYEHAAA